MSLLTAEVSPVGPSWKASQAHTQGMNIMQAHLRKAIFEIQRCLVEQGMATFDEQAENPDPQSE